MPLKQSSPRNKQAKNIPFEEISEGRKIIKEYEITQAVYDCFLGAFGDYNSLHTNEEYAVAKGFSSKVMYGAVLNGFISEFVGMEFPGENSILQSVQVEFKKPNYLNDRLRFEAAVEQKIDAVKTVVLKFEIYNMTRSYLAAKARVQVGMF